MDLTLVLARHGEAEDGHGKTDHARRLTRLGEEEARTLSERLGRAGLVPQLALCSDAARAASTARYARAAWAGQGPDFIELGELYMPSFAAVRAVLLRYAVGPVQAAILVGHNPGFSQVASLLTGQTVSLATGEAVEVTIVADSWSEAMAMTGLWSLGRFFG